MVKLEVDEKDAELLHDILSQYLTELRDEISNTDNYDFREGLKGREAFIKDFISQLERTAQYSDAPPSTRMS